MAETEGQPSNSKRIAKNALMLYVRMFLSMIVGLYTSRVVLNTLGVEDYGIYGVVGGVVSMMGFLNASMSGATSRFITFELGKGNTQQLKDTFSSAMIVHIGIAMVVFIVAETIGLWFLNNKLVIPENRMYAANWVYQLSIFSAMLGITQVPYNACIIAHERMGIYAYIEILNVSLKLLIVYLLLIGNFDKLILYAILTLAVSVIVIMTYRIYCIRNFSECHFHWIWDKKILKPLLSFSGWDLYGNISVTVRLQGTNFLINMFFGVILNTASSITSTIVGVITGLATNISNAFRPVIIKYYAAKQFYNMQDAMTNNAVFMLLIMGIPSIPLLIDTSFYINLWLETVPTYTDIFCRILIGTTLFGLINSVIVTGIHATGHVSLLSFISGSVYLLNIPTTYLIFKQNHAPEAAYFIQSISTIIVLVINSFIIKNLIPQLSLSRFYIKISKVFIILLITGASCLFLKQTYPTINFLFIILCDFFIAIILSYIFLFNKYYKNIIRQKICQIFQ